MRASRIWHGVTAVVAAFGLVVQLLLVVRGDSVLVAESPPGLAERLLRFVSYFTIQANTLVLLATLGLARNPQRDGQLWRVLRFDAVLGIAVTGIVHWFFLRPLLNLTGWSYAVDKLLHVVVPLLGVVGWLIFGPRPRVTRRVILLALIWPFAWLVVTLIMGGLRGWYPYPFLDIDQVGGGTVAIASLGIAALIFAGSALLWLGDRKLPER